MSHHDPRNLIDELIALQGSMLSYARRRLGNEADAEDAVGEVNLQMLHGGGLGRYDPAQGPLNRFVTGSLRFVVYEALRQRGRGMVHGAGVGEEVDELGASRQQDHTGHARYDSSTDYMIDSLPPEEAARGSRFGKSWSSLTAGDPLGDEVVSTALEQFLDLFQSRSGGVSFAGRALEPGRAELDRRRGGRYEEALLKVVLSDCLRRAGLKGHEITEETLSIGAQRLVLGRPVTAVTSPSGEGKLSRAKIDQCVKRAREYLRHEDGFRLAVIASKARELVLRGEA